MWAPGRCDEAVVVAVADDGVVVAVAGDVVVVADGVVAVECADDVVVDVAERDVDTGLDDKVLLRVDGELIGELGVAVHADEVGGGLLS